MHTIVTKETWSSDPDNAPLPSDFNRIESNTRKVEENRQEETTARQNADTTLQNNIDSEATARANADTAEATARLNGDAGYYGSSVNLTDYPIGSIILARSINARDRNETVAPSYIGVGATQFFTLDVAPGNLDGIWKARGVIVGGGGYYGIICQRIS